MMKPSDELPATPPAALSVPFSPTAEPSPRASVPETEERTRLPIPASNPRKIQQQPRASMREPSPERLLGCFGSCYETRSWAIFVGVIDVAAVLPMTCISLVLGLENRRWEETPRSDAAIRAADPVVLTKLVGISVGYWSIFRFIAVAFHAYLVVQGTRRSQAWMLRCCLINDAANLVVSAAFIVAYGAVGQDSLTVSDGAVIATLAAIMIIGAVQFPIVLSRYKRSVRLAKTATDLTRSSLPYGHLA